jgi:Transcriptional regulator PadR-like family
MTGVASHAAGATVPPSRVSSRQGNQAPPCILLAVLEASPRHGYAIMEALRARSGGQLDLPNGTVYPALHRLERGRPDPGVLVDRWWPTVPGLRADPGRATGTGHRTQRLARLLELRSGLMDAADARQSAGLARCAAEQAAVSEFGDPGQVARGFRQELAACQARRVATALLASGPVTGLLWIATARASHLTIRLAPPWQEGGLPAGLPAGIMLVAAAVAVTACAAVLGIATTGRLTRWLPDRPWQAPIAAAVAGYGAVGADALGLALLASLLATAPVRLSPLLAAAAAVASLVGAAGEPRRTALPGHPHRSGHALTG